MFCCAGLASICRSPFLRFDAAPLSREGNWLQLSPVGSYNTALSRAFQRPAKIYSPECPGVWRAQQSFPDFVTNRLSFIFRASHLQSSVPAHNFETGASNLIEIHFPTDPNTNLLMWFRWSSVLTVLMGLAYWGNIVASDARNGGASSGGPMATFFAIWTIAWALMYACTIPGKGALDKGPVLAVIYAVIVVAASCLFLRFNDHDWESNRLLAIGIGGGMGWVMMLNVWGVIWRAQKKIIHWTADNAA